MNWILWLVCFSQLAGQENEVNVLISNPNKWTVYVTFLMYNGPYSDAIMMEWAEIKSDEKDALFTLQPTSFSNVNFAFAYRTPYGAVRIPFTCEPNEGEVAIFSGKQSCVGPPMAMKSKPFDDFMECADGDELTTFSWVIDLSYGKHKGKVIKLTIPTLSQLNPSWYKKFDFRR